MAAKKKSGKTRNSDDLDLVQNAPDKYYIKGGRAYVSVGSSGDVFGPFGKSSAAYDRALKDMMSGRTVEAGTRSMLEGMRGWMRGGGGLRSHGK
jgi:hypothetical protein